MPLKDELKKHIEKKTVHGIVILYNILWDFLIIAAMFFGVWLLHYLAKLLGMESSYFIKILNLVSEIGFIIMFLILAIWNIFVIYKLFKE